MQAWKTSTIITSFKSGDASMPTNYRGIAISNALHKVLTKILNKRLMKFMIEHKKWNEYQNVFMEKKVMSKLCACPSSNYLNVLIIFYYQDCIYSHTVNTKSPYTDV